MSEFEAFCDGSYLLGIANYIKNSCGVSATDEEILQALLSFIQDKTGFSYLSDNSLQYECNMSGKMGKLNIPNIPSRC